MIAQAVELGFRFVQDNSTNYVHLATENNQALCNKRFNVYKVPTELVTEFSCTRCITKLQREIK
jgi:hypothetical protein